MSVETRPLKLEYKSDVEYLYRKYGNDLSSHAFTSIYLWRREMGLDLLLTDDMFAVRCAWRGRNTWFFPCGEDCAVEEFIGLHIGEPDFQLCYMRLKDVAFLQDRFPKKFIVSRDRNADEYVYDTAGHIALKGGVYANMRTQVHKVEKEYSISVQELDAGNIDKGLEIIDVWSHGHRRFDGISIRDDDVDQEALRQFRQLDMRGVILCLDGNPAAVAAGFYINDDTFDVAVSKSVTTAQGVSYYIKRELFKISERPYANMEEDLGIPGLRKMKNGLKPIRMNEMWEAKCVWSE